MPKVYYRWSPIRRGLTGAEYLGQWCRERFPGVTVTDVVSDGTNYYSIVEGTGDEFRKAIRSIETKFSAQKLTDFEMIGAIRVIYGNPTASPEEGITPPTWDMFATNFGFTVDVALELDYVRAYKLMLLKEQARVRFPEWNDSLADLAKALFAKLIWYNECTVDEQAAIDNAIANIKNIYTKDTCIRACDTLAANLANLVDYYTAKQQVMAALTVDEILTVEF